MSGECLSCHSPICFCDDLKKENVMILEGKGYYSVDWHSPVNWGNCKPHNEYGECIQMKNKNNVEDLKKEIKALRLILISHGQIIKLNSELKRKLDHLTDVYASPNEILRRRNEYLDEAIGYKNERNNV